jgi:hypothetical protein
MAKKQSRRTISINRALYERVKLHAQTTGTPMSQLTEVALDGVIGNATDGARSSFFGELETLKKKWGIA